MLDAARADRGLPGGRRRLLALDRGRQPALSAPGQGLRRLARALGDDRPGARRRRPALGGDRARDPPRRRAHLRRRDVGQRDEAQLRGARRARSSTSCPSRPARCCSPAPASSRPTRSRCATATGCGSPWKASACSSTTSTGAAGRVTRVPLSITRPGKIVCVGLNYHDHAEEGGAELPKAPLLFAKWPNTLIGARRPDRPARRSPRRSTTRPSSASSSGPRPGTSPSATRSTWCRLHLRQRRQRARPAVRRRAVDAREVARHLLPRRPAARAARGDRRPAGAGHPLRAQRRDDAGLLDGADDLLGRRDHRLRHAASSRWSRAT